MSYEVGTRIDLTHINKKAEAVQKKSRSAETARTLYEVGTQFLFNPQTGKLAIKIPVAFA